VPSIQARLIDQIENKEKTPIIATSMNMVKADDAIARRRAMFLWISFIRNTFFFEPRSHT
jgi:pyruvate kinase